VETSLVPLVTNTCAVVVTYFPDAGTISNIVQVQKQLASIIIVDNTPKGSNLPALSKFSSVPAVDLIKNDRNEGLGKALNQAAALAIESGFLWMLTLDQDTVVHDDMFVTLAEIYESNVCNPPIIGSNYTDVSKNKQFFKCSSQANNEFIERRTVITSGTLMRLDLFKRIGGFKEDYFIDSIDHEYCLRARASGYKVVMSCKNLMSHSIGHQNSRGSRILAFDHPPIRKYYMARNTLVTVKRYFFREPRWAICQLVRLFVEFFSIVLVEGEKREKGKAFCRGVIDGIKNNMGEMNQPDE